MALPRPEGYHSVTPYLVVPDAKELIVFLKRVLGATELYPPMLTPDGRVAHAELRVGDSPVMMGEASDEWRPMPAMLYVYVDEPVDTVFQRALGAGATKVREPADQFYGDRNATFRDPSGNVWSVAQHVEDVPPEELERRAKAEHGS
jgi:PhnB protein